MKRVGWAVWAPLCLGAAPCPSRESLELNNLGVRAHAEGNLHVAAGLLERALSSAESCAHSGKPDPSADQYNALSTVLSNLAESEAALGLLAAAQTHAARALATATPPQRARATSILGRVYALQGRYQEAEQSYRQSLQLRESPATLNNLAECLRLQRRFNVAIQMAERSLRMASHRERAAALNTLGQVYLALQQWEPAGTALREALEIHERESGMHHPDSAAVRNNLGYLAESQGRYGEAAGWYRAAWKAFETVYGREHPETAKAMNNVAHVMALEGGEAGPLFRDALGICERTLPEAHPECNQIGANYLSYLKRTGDRKGAARLEKKLIAWLKARKRAEPGSGMVVDLRTLPARKQSERRD